MPHRMASSIPASELPDPRSCFAGLVHGPLYALAFASASGNDDNDEGQEGREVVSLCLLFPRDAQNENSANAYDTDCG